MNRYGVAQPVMVCHREHSYDIYDIWWLQDVKKASYKVGPGSSDFHRVKDYV